MLLESLFSPMKVGPLVVETGAIYSLDTCGVFLA
jgi:hypothetical protein